MDYPELRKRPERMLLCNGEIYNDKELKESEGLCDKDLCSDSDVEVILPLYIKHGIEKALDMIDGEFAFVLTDNTRTFNPKETQVYVARDPLGIRPLYKISNSDASFFLFVSELECLKGVDTKGYTIQEFPPGHYWSYQTNSMTQYFSFARDDKEYEYNDATPETLEVMYEKTDAIIRDSVNRVFNENNTIGVLLSDGFDSAVISERLSERLSERQQSELHCFSYGTHTGTECVNALRNAFPIQIKHHGICDDSLHLSLHDKSLLDTIQGGVDDTNVVLYTLLKYIKEKTLVRVVLCGEGLDNMFPRNCPSDDEYQEHSIRSLSEMYLHNLDKLDRIAGLFDIEIRYPFLSKKFIQHILSIHPKLRRERIHDGKIITKYIIRKSIKSKSILPDDILWRPAKTFHKGCHIAFHNV
jgi:asparagine synthase (glutamine-hydrolysing)